jgi:GAF domain-containing protein
MQEIEDQRRHYAQDHAIIEEQNNNLANLYVSTYGLHGTLDRGEVLRVIKEIIANLIGCEECAIYEIDGRGKSLELLASAGLELDVYRSLPTDSGVIANCVQTGKTYITGKSEPSDLAYEQNLTACIPLTIEGNVTGAIALFRLLGHKPSLEPLDFELFDLLSTQASIALHTTKFSYIDPDEASSES